MEPTTPLPGAEVPAEAPPRTPWAALLFCLVLVLIGLVFLVISLKRVFAPPVAAPVPMNTYDLAEEARKLVRQKKAEPLSPSLEKVLARARDDHFDTYKHRLLGKVAPEFTRSDADGKTWSLKDALKKGPVVVVFYLGYHCDHCVSQLFDLNEDIAHFRELGASVVALSPDSSDWTRTQYKEYGRFGFPVLSDHGSRVAQAYDVFTPAADGKPEALLHGTFILDRDGVVRWCAFGQTPFGHNLTLLYELARITGRMPPK